MNILGQIKEKIFSYFDVHIKLVKINFILRTSNVLSYMMFAMIGLLILFAIMLFAGFALSEVFIEVGFSKLASFFMVTGIYLLLFALLVACRRGITRFFSSRLISVLTEGDEEDREESGKE